ncbi:hypothetical protein D3C75_1137020 [compost metagenome]
MQGQAAVEKGFAEYRPPRQQPPQADASAYSGSLHGTLNGGATAHFDDKVDACPGRARLNLLVPLGMPYVVDQLIGPQRPQTLEPLSAGGQGQHPRPEQLGQLQGEH